MPHHKISSKKDILEIMSLPYEDGAIFEILETGEEITLPDLLHTYNNQEIIIQHI